MSWFDQINKEIKSNASSIADEKKQWEKHSIYKVPSQITELNKKAYKPQTISFGPYHHGEDNLKPMEEHKHRALLHFLKRCRKPIELIIKKLDEVAQELKDSYKSLEPSWINDTPKFIQMMIFDGCFIFEILNSNTSTDYDKNDPVFGENGKFYLESCIERDMLMLENQIPMAVLHALIQISLDKEEDYHELLNKKIIKSLNRGGFSKNLGKCMHVLDVYRKSVIQKPSYISQKKREPSLDDHLNRSAKEVKEAGINFKTSETSIEVSEEDEDEEDEDEDDLNRSAMELKEAGISFKKSKTRSLRDVSFNRGVLRLPKLVVHDGTKCMFLNLIAFELLHVVATGKEVISFVCFIDTIIDSAVDVAILIRSGIIINYLESDKAVAKLFNSLAKEIPMDREVELEEVTKSMISYCKKPWKSWRASLIHTYFRNPWAMVSLIAAFFLFVLTIIQTIYTVGQFYQKD